MQHAEFPSCLRFSFTRNKLEKSRKPSSSACACSLPRLERKPWQSLSKVRSCLHVRNLRVFMQNIFVGEIHYLASKLVNVSENSCSFSFDKKYDELRWFRLTRVTAYGMNIFR